MSAASMIQLALGLLRLVGWITRKVDQAEWTRAGYDKAMAEEMAAIRGSVGAAEAALVEAANATPAERRKSLGRAT